MCVINFSKTLQEKSSHNLRLLGNFLKWNILAGYRQDLVVKSKTAGYRQPLVTKLKPAGRVSLLADIKALLIPVQKLII